MKTSIFFVSLVVLSTSLGALVTAMTGGGLSTQISLLALIAGGVFAGFISMKAHPSKRLSGFEWAVFIGFSFFMCREFLWIFYSKGDGYHTLNVSNFGDLPLHVTYIQNFFRGERIWPEDPIFIGSKLHYHFGLDFFNALIMKAGLSLEGSLVTVGVCLSVVLGYAVVQWSGAVGLGALLFSGGLLGLKLLDPAGSHDPQSELAWKNLVLTLVITQRGFLLSIPLGLFLLTSWRRRLFQNQEALIPWWAEGILWGLLPLFHLHSFLFVSFCFAYWVLIKKAFNEWKVLALAIIPGSIEVFMLTEGFTKASMTALNLGWMIKGENPLLFMIVNFGAYFPLILVTLWLAIKGKDHCLHVLIPSLAVFALMFIFKLSPWEWDNTKLMIWAYLGTLPALNEMVFEGLEQKRFGFTKQTSQLISVSTIVIWWLPGFLFIQQAYFSPGYQIFERSETASVCTALKSLDLNRRFATVSTFNHPVGYCGGKVVAGYEGHLWSHGTDSSRVQSLLKPIMMGQPSWQENARALGVGYIFWGKREISEFPGSTKVWSQSLSKVASGSWGEIFAIEDSK